METSTTEKRGGELTLREAILPAKVSDWRAKLSTKAKQEKRFGFYSLYGLIGHAETLKGAWHQVRANGGAAGVDGISIEQIEHQGAEQWLEALGKELREKTYRCAAVRRVYIPKANGKLRPLGIPTVRDRVVQAAVLLILEPIFEADFEDCSYGFRPGRNAHQALEKIRENLRARKCEIYDADLEGYFDSIPHDKLMACVKMRVVDGSVLKLIKQWLKAPVQEEDQQGRKKIGRNKSGTPQGGVLCGRLRDYGAVHEPADSELHRAEIGGMAGANTQPRQDPDSQSTPEPRALRVPRLSNRFGPCEGGPRPPLLAPGAEPQGDEARSGQNLGDDGAQIRMETAARTHRRAKSAPQGLGELLPAWPTTDSLPTDQSLRTATALSAPAPQ